MRAEEWHYLAEWAALDIAGDQHARYLNDAVDAADDEAEGVVRPRVVIPRPLVYAARDPAAIARRIIDPEYRRAYFAERQRASRARRAEMGAEGREAKAAHQREQRRLKREKREKDRAYQLRYWVERGRRLRAEKKAIIVVA